MPSSSSYASFDYNAYKRCNKSYFSAVCASQGHVWRGMPGGWPSADWGDEIVVVGG
jgi:hypothetical protein